LADTATPKRSTTAPFTLADENRDGYWSTATLLNLEVDLLFFDTTSTYFETDEADAPTRTPADRPGGGGG
jgi:hypothetical protein